MCCSKNVWRCDCRFEFEFENFDYWDFGELGCLKMCLWMWWSCYWVNKKGCERS